LLPAFLFPGEYAADLTQMGERKIIQLDRRQCSIQGIRGNPHRRSIRAITQDRKEERDGDLRVSV
jgi:hypothetical protein